MQHWSYVMRPYDRTHVMNPYDRTHVMRPYDRTHVMRPYNHDITAIIFPNLCGSNAAHHTKNPFT